MNADVRHYSNEIDDFQLHVPEQALRRLWLHLGRARSLGEAWDASSLFGAPPGQVSELLDHWLEGFDFRAAETRLNRLGLRRLQGTRGALVFGQRRSPEPAAMPLLLLTETTPTVESLLGPLAEPRRHEGSPEVAFHVVVPLQLGSRSADPEALAGTCAELMRALGHARYLVHGSGCGAALAQRLAELDAGHVAGVHLTRLVAFPPDDPCELAALTSREKSQLALLRELDAERRFNAPRSALEQLALMLAQLVDCSDGPARFRERLLTSLTLRALAGPPEGDAEAGSWSGGSGSTVPMALSAFPLDAPSLRRFAERRQRVLSWTEHASGGAFPELEQPELLLRELREFFGRFG